eukprot:54813-Eustigmatos_ZCMA.PRE.1
MQIQRVRQTPTQRNRGKHPRSLSLAAMAYSLSQARRGVWTDLRMGHLARWSGLLLPAPCSIA